MKNQKIIRSGTKDAATVSGSVEECDSFALIMFGERSQIEETEESKVDFVLNDLVFGVGYCSYKNERIFTFEQDAESLKMLIPAEHCLDELPDREVDIKHFARLGDFWMFTVCQLCDGAGRLSRISCDKPAAECCGGCIEYIECECEEPVYQIN